MYKLGTEVKIIKEGNSYTTYTEMAKLMELQYYMHNVCPEKNMVGTVIAKSYHKDYDRLLYGIRVHRSFESDMDFIIDDRGVEENLFVVKIDGEEFKLNKDELKKLKEFMQFMGE